MADEDVLRWNASLLSESWHFTPSAGCWQPLGSSWYSMLTGVARKMPFGHWRWRILKAHRDRQITANRTKNCQLHLDFTASGTLAGRKTAFNFLMLLIFSNLMSNLMAYLEFLFSWSW